jgi:hypothetical protein
MVPRVLNALQGRKLASEVIEAALASGDVDAEIQDYARLKGELRDLLRQVEAAEGRGLGAFDIGGGPGGVGGGLRGFESFAGVVAGGFERRRDEGTLERLRAEFRDKERALATTREKVAELPGFEVLRSPLEKMSLEAVRSKLARGEALVLVLPVERQAGPETTVVLELEVDARRGASTAADAVTKAGTKAPAGFETRLWVLRAEGDPEVIVLPEATAEDAAWEASLQGLGRAFAAFNAGQSGRGGMRRGGWEADMVGAEDTQAEVDDAASDLDAELLDGSDDAGEVLRGEVALSLPPGVSEAEAFWPRMSGAMDRLFWSPLRASGALEGVETLLLATTGPLHNLPFAAGRREDDPELWQVNSLVTWALGRGLYGAGAAQGGKAAEEASMPTPAPGERVSGLPHRVGVLSNPESTDIPLAGAEVALAARLWQAEAPQGSGRAVITDTAHPWQPEEALQLVHLACHGSIDTRPGETPRAVIGVANRRTTDPKARVVTERDLLAGPPAREVLMNLCVGGQAYDDLLDGDPTGLIPAWLRHGAHTVVAALPPVPDLHGALFGTTVMLLMTDPEDSLPLAAAARRAARILGEDPELASPRLAARMAGLLPDLALTAVMEAVRWAHKGHRGGPVAPAISRELGRMLTGKSTRNGQRLGRPPVLWWLNAEADRQLIDLPEQIDRAPTEADVLSLLASLRPDPDRDGIRAVFPDPQAFPLDAQTIRYGYAVFGDPNAARQKA